jgi:hypothetical protein
MGSTMSEKSTSAKGNIGKLGIFYEENMKLT